MARQIFTLRNLGTDLGEYVEYNDSLFASASLSPFVDTEFYLDVKTVDYGTTEISWSAPLFTLQEDILPVEILVVWSSTGEPQTIEDGYTVIQNASNVGTVEHTPNNAEELSGRWVYYSLFLRFASTVPSLYFDQEQYFEKVASVSVLLPNNYGSVDDLWSRIPVYFRENDDNQELYNYLSIFGWDIDYIRSLLDYVMVQKDPQISNSETLQYLMEELGTVITTVELGASRARQYLQDVISLRLQKGTEDGTIAVLQAISGCRVTIDKVAKKINVHPQRTNWARDPKIIRGLQDGWYGAVTDNINVRFSQDLITFYDSSVTFTNNASVAFNPVRSIVNGGDVEANVYIFSRFLVPISADNTFYFSAESPANDQITNVYMYKPDATLAASAGIGTNKVIKTSGGRTYYKLDMSDIGEDTSAYLFIQIKIPPGGYVLVRNLLLEDNYMGKYFDGNTNIGGWLLGDVSRSDYRWHNNPTLGTDGVPTWEYFETYSIYSADAWRTRKTINNIYKKLLPVNWMDQYTIVFDELPEYTYDPATPNVLPNFGTMLSLSVLSSNIGIDPVGDVAFTELGWPNVL
jgi:hypothetical protein